MGYLYYLDGSVNQLTYPSGATVTYTPNSAARMLSAVDSGNGINYATSATYDPTGALSGFVSGNGSGFAGITNSFSFNKRLQPILMSAASPTQTVFSIGYDFHLSNGDNGNVFGITNNRDATRNQTFTYDQLNRLVSAQNTGTDCSHLTVNGKTKFWGNSYGYDAWGNLLSKTVTKCSAESLNNITASGINQIHTTSGTDFGYDAAGNMTHDATTGNNYSYDAENRITGAAGYTYTYDADGNRVEKSNGSTGTIYWSMSPGIVAESDLKGNLTSEYVFFGGRRMARKDFPSGAVSYYFSDHLGTASVITDAAGNIKEDEDFNPFGAELSLVNSDSNKYKFGGHELDGETGLYDYGARHYESALSRFMTPDWNDVPEPVPYADLNFPQSLNLYGYTRNNPVSLADPDGHDCVVQTRTSETKESVTVSSGNCDNVKVGDGQTKTFVDGTVTSVKAGADGRSIDIGYTQKSADGSEASTGVTNANAAPYPNSPATAYYFGNNAQGYRQLATASGVLNDGRTYALWFGASALVGGALAATGAVGGGSLTTLAGEDGLGLVANQTINRMIGAAQRELLKDFFKSGKLPQGLSEKTLQLYKTIAQRAIAAGKDQLGVQAQRLQMINNAIH